jgi:hypothetical protein
MKTFVASTIPGLVSSAALRWRGPFRSHTGFALLALLLAVIFVFLVLQLTQDKPNNGSTGNKTGSS